MMSLWRSFSGNVFALSNWSCLLISVSESHWRVESNCFQTERQIQQDAWGSSRIAHVFQQRLYENCMQLIEKEQWPVITLQIWIPWRYHVWWETHKTILKPSSETQNSFRIKSCTGVDIGQFSVGSINKAVPSFRSSLTGVHEGWWKTFWVFSSTKKCSHLRYLRGFE